MQDPDDGEVEIRMETSEDQKVITLVFISSVAMETNDFILALESYLTDITRAAFQREQPESQVH